MCFKCSVFILVFIKFGTEVKHQAGLKVCDESGTQIDSDVFKDLVKNPNCGVLKLKPAEENGEFYDGM